MSGWQAQSRMRRSVPDNASSAVNPSPDADTDHSWHLCRSYTCSVSCAVPAPTTPAHLFSPQYPQMHDPSDNRYFLHHSRYNRVYSLCICSCRFARKGFLLLLLRASLRLRYLLHPLICQFFAEFKVILLRSFLHLL